MPKKNKILYLLIIIALTSLPIFIVLALNSQNQSPHNGQGICTDCHLHDPEKSSDDNRSLMIKDIDILCKKCHQIQQGLSHPSNKQVNWQIPKVFPLDWAGRITCATCHYTHLSNRSNNTSYRIRTESIGRPFCEKCHNDLHKRISGKHSQMIDLSHIGGVDLNKEARSLLDQASLQCLGCHDGTMAQISSINSPGSKKGAWQHSKIGMSHPIGIDYPPPMNLKKRSKYHPISMLDPKIRLFQGKLGCCTCHEPYSEKKHGLVMDNKGSTLCLQCHAM